MTQQLYSYVYATKKKKERKEKTAGSNRYLHTHIHCSIIHSSQKVEITHKGGMPVE